MALFRISLGFKRKKDADLDNFASNVVVKMTEHAVIFDHPPESMAVLGAAQVAFHDSLAIAKGGGTAATLDKKTRRAVLLDLLRQNAFYVQGIPNLTPEDARLSGYDVVMSGHYGPVAVQTPMILDIINVASTKLGIKLRGVHGAKIYQFRGTVGNNAPVILGSASSTRGIVLENLVPGTVYVLQVRAVFGSKRYSEWSDPVSHMCT